MLEQKDAEKNLQLSPYFEKAFVIKEKLREKIFQDTISQNLASKDQVEYFVFHFKRIIEMINDISRWILLDSKNISLDLYFLKKYKIYL